MSPIFESLEHGHSSIHQMETEKKLDPKSQEGIFVGYCDASKAFRIWIHEKQRVVISRDVLIDENNVFKGPSNEDRHVLIFPEPDFSEVADSNPTLDEETLGTPSGPGIELLNQDPEPTEKDAESEQSPEDEQNPVGEQNMEQTLILILNHPFITPSFVNIWNQILYNFRFKLHCQHFF